MPACDSITTLSDGIRPLGGIRVGLGGGWLGFDVTLVTSHCSKLENMPAVCMSGRPGPLEGRQGHLIIDPPPALLAPPQHSDPIPFPHFRRLSPHNHHLCSPNLAGANVTDIICSR